MNSLARYLSEARKIHSFGSVPETSYYPPLSELLNTIGLGLSPKVRCVVHPKSQGAGIPDLALFSADQIPASGEPIPGVIPSRGVIEAKGAGENIDRIAASRQVAKYLERYGQVLVTNLREFLLVTADGPKERFVLAASEADFWSQTDDSLHEGFVAFLKRVLLSNSPLREPKDVAWLLASYAREARARILDNDLDALKQLRSALEEALGITFTCEKGDNFFRSTLVQTLFYGIFSAWVLWSRRHPAGRFDWRTASYELRVPMIKALFHQAADPSRLEPLGLVEILDWAGDALSRIDREAFFARFEAESAVQYFYEPFLEAFDPELRKELGVWYTPREIVRYQVERVDRALRDDLGIAAGLADPDVVVLDPCCGTGAYLVEVLRLIHERLTEGGTDMLALADVQKAAVERVFGFEILPAPFVVAHLQLGLLLQTMGISLSIATQERVGVYLTNALTGWDGEPPQKAMLFPELLAERDAAGRVKRRAKILVILGNPPYNGFAGIAVEEERSLSDAYRTVKLAPRPQGQGLNDLYIRFFRMAERHIVERSGRGIVCYISNYSWLDGLSFTGMRERYLEAFDSIQIDCLNGDKYKTGKLTPEGLPDPSVFSTEFNREGIQVGTAIALMVRRGAESAPASVHFRNLWGRTKRTQLLESLSQPQESPYQPVAPSLALGLPFVPMASADNYLKAPLLTELFPVSFPGVTTSRDAFLVDIDRDRLERRVRSYFDPAIGDEAMRQIAPVAMEEAARFDARATRAHLQKRGYGAGQIVRYCYRPFDTRWLYWEPETKLLDEKRPDYMQQIFEGNVFLAAVHHNRKAFDPPIFATQLCSYHIIERGANLFPLLLRPVAQRSLLDEENDTPHPNFSTAAHDYLARIGNDDAPDPLLLFYHALAILHAPRYREENIGALRQDWPRIPLPSTRERLIASSALGRQIAALLDTGTPVAGVTMAPVRDDLKSVAHLTHSDRVGLQEGDLAITAGWGNPTKTGIMPGRGKIEEQPDGKLDIYLNAKVAWRGIPTGVWQYTIGGYQVMKKWLSYREQTVLGRPLSIEEAREVQQMSRRIAALLSLEPALDANYEAVCSMMYSWGNKIKLK